MFSTEPSYAESFKRFKKLMASSGDPFAPLRAHQIFGCIRQSQAPSTKSSPLNWIVRSAYQYVAHLILAVWTLGCAVLIRARACGASGHFCVDLMIQGRLDHRSAFFRRVLRPGSVVELYHYGDAWASVRSLRSKSMALYPEALVRVLWPFWFGATGSWWRKKPEGELVAMLQQQALYGKVYFLVIRALLSFLGMRRLLLLDDPRNVGVYCHAARALGIPTTGYMHGKFNVYHVGLVASPFDVYLVWSPYFGAKIASMWGERYPGKVVVCGLIRDALFIPAREALPDNVLRVLWLDEDGVPLSEIRPYIEKLKGMSHVKVLFRPKPRAAAAHASFPDWYLSAFPHDGQVSFLQSLAHHHVDAVIGCHSTALLEAAMLGVAPVAVITSFDYARDLGEDGVVFPCGSPEQMFAQLEALAASPSHSPPSDWPTLKLAIEPFQPRVAQQELSDQGFVLDAAVLHTGHTACQS